MLPVAQTVIYNVSRSISRIRNKVLEKQPYVGVRLDSGTKL
jgi:hypothetical protein